MRHSQLFVLLVAVLTLVCVINSAAHADTLKLKDGSTVEGRVIPQGTSYWVKLADGTTKLIPKDQVVSITKGDTPAPANSDVPSSAPARDGAGKPSGGSPGFTTVEARTCRSR
jgi:hypothetical protein